MAMTNAQIAECLREAGSFLEKIRPPEHLRNQVDYRVDIIKSEVILTSIRPQYNDPLRLTEAPVAKVKWIATCNEWRIFWMRADFKWHRYDSRAEVSSLKEAFEEIKEDPWGCFFG